MQRERTERQITTDLMARMLRVEKAQLTRFENGDELPVDDVLLRFADVLDVPLDMLLAGVESAKRLEADVREVTRFAVDEAFARIDAHASALRRLAAALYDVDKGCIEIAFVSFSQTEANGWSVQARDAVRGQSIWGHGSSIEDAAKELGVELLKAIQKAKASNEAHVGRLGKALAEQAKGDVQ